MYYLDLYTHLVNGDDIFTINKVVLKKQLLLHLMYIFNRYDFIVPCT